MSRNVEQKNAGGGAEPQPTGDGEFQSAARSEGSELPALARRAVETFTRERHVIQPPPLREGSMLRRAAACFISIKTELKELRGCIGTIEPASPTLAEEIIHNAISAATRDPRFPPVSEDELPFLRYSVDVLSGPEPTRLEDLNPATYGVIVEDEAGRRRGLLLPDIEGVESAEQQVQIAARKAGITPGTPLRLYRFRVHRFREAARPQPTNSSGEHRPMANDNTSKSSLGESNAEPELKPDATPEPIEDINPANDERAIDYGESGQFAPGGRYNQLGATQPRRIDLDDQVDSALSDEKK